MCSSDLSLFGVMPDAAEKQIAFAPHTPIGWDGWKIENIAVGDAKFSLVSERISPSQCRYTVTASEPGWHVIVLENGEGKAHAIDGTLSLVMGD